MSTPALISPDPYRRAPRREQAPASAGFTVVELLITLFVAAAFLMAGYQLFNVIIVDGGDTRAESRAGNVAYDYLRRYSDSATNPCAASVPLSDSSLSVDGLDLASVSVTITCPASDAPTLSKIEATITYGNPAKTVNYATYVDKSKGATPNVDVTAGLVGRWLFNGNADTDVGTANGTAVGGVTLTTNRDGVANRAYAFNGVNGYVTVPYVPSLDVGASFSVSAWVYPNTLATRQGVFSTRTANAAGALQFEVGIGNGGTNRVSVVGQGVWVFDSVNNAVTTGAWQHILYVMPSSGSSAGVMYVNGVSVGASSTNPSYAFANNTDARHIGQGTSGTQQFNGSIDDVRLYNRALSGSEALQLYNEGPK